MNVFLSYAVGQVEAVIAARLRAVAAAYDISILLPDRTLTIDNELPADTLKKIRQSDAVIGLLTRNAQAVSMHLIDLVSLELQAAEQAGKPIIALVEQGVSFQGLPQDRIVYFNPLTPHVHEHSIMNALEHIRQQQQWKKGLTALGWIAGIALGLVALSELGSDEK